MINHSQHNHPATKAGRAACRKAIAAHVAASGPVEILADGTTVAVTPPTVSLLKATAIEAELSKAPAPAPATRVRKAPSKA